MQLALRLTISEAALLHGRLLADLEDAFGRPIRQGEAKALVILIRRIGRPELQARLDRYRQAVQGGVGKPVTAAQWVKHHGLLWEVQHAA